MRLGCCAPIEQAHAVAELGFAFIEPPLARDLAPLTGDAEFAAKLDQFKRAPIKAEAFNIFIPGELRITGEKVDLNALARYAEVAARRAALVGAETIVFGSGGARKVPDGFAHATALDQIRRFLERVAPIVEKHGVRIAVEPLCRKECNIINTVAEGDALSRSVGSRGVCVLADLYHVGQENEPLEHMTAAGANLIHVHIADPVTRIAPGSGSDVYRRFFSALKRGGYDGRVSLECRWDNMAAQGRATIEFLRSEWEAAEGGKGGKANA